MRDLFSNIGAVQALGPAVQAASANGAAIDTRGYNRIAFVVNTGAIVSAGDFNVKLQESDVSGSGYTDVAAAQAQTNAPATLAADSTYRLGYLGYKRYVRLVLTKAGGTSIAASAVAILGDPAHSPVA